MFQSTHPRRVRPSPIASLTYSSCFNPRTHVGCDLCLSVDTLRHQRFNPRTHVGCDDRCAASYQFDRGFNPRTHVGCDAKPLGCVIIAQSFNPRTHVGCDAMSVSTFLPTPSFQSTHPRRVRLYMPCLGEETDIVSIHAPT